MPFKIRSSKYRHVYGSAHKEDSCYKNIKITKNAAHDSAFCAVNPKFVAIVTEECGGGAFVVLPIKQSSRQLIIARLQLQQRPKRPGVSHRAGTLPASPANEVFLKVT